MSINFVVGLNPIKRNNNFLTHTRTHTLSINNNSKFRVVFFLRLYNGISYARTRTHQPSTENRVERIQILIGRAFIQSSACELRIVNEATEWTATKRRENERTRILEDGNGSLTHTRWQCARCECK